ncbi:duboraya [Myripristis murdjan]|uniref:duboraya n=1 Tax=Myripristis murdjan TaxID=586833 RepID=UPI0011763673|nr:capZ-interacting protein-like [Myripristis murdjan]
MEDEAPAKRSVAELAGRFSSAPPDATGSKAEPPVRRRPPRTLQLPKPAEQHETPAAVTSPVKAKRNSALIEKLQANLAVSPMLTSPKSPGLKLLPPSFVPPSPCSVAVVTPTSPCVSAPAKSEEEGPASFEAPPTAVEGSILQSINKGRARHSIRRRPPSRRHRKSSSGEEVDTPLLSPSDPEAKTTTTTTTTTKTTTTTVTAGETDGEAFRQEDTTEQPKSSTPEEETASNCTEEDRKQQEEEEEEEEEAPGSSSERKEEEEEEEEEEAGRNPTGEQEEGPGPDEEEKASTERKEDAGQSEQTDCPSSEG